MAHVENLSTTMIAFNQTAVFQILLSVPQNPRAKASYTNDFAPVLKLREIITAEEEIPISAQSPNNQ